MDIKKMAELIESASNADLRDELELAGLAMKKGNDRFLADRIRLSSGEARDLIASCIPASRWPEFGPVAAKPRP